MKEYTELLAQAGATALKRIVEEAKETGANAVVGVRFSTSAIAGGYWFTGQL